MPIFKNNSTYLLKIEERKIKDNIKRLDFITTQGMFCGIANLVNNSTCGVLFLSGANGCVCGPNLLFARLSDELAACGISSIRLNYRNPGDCRDCAIDALYALQFLDDEGIEDMLIIGYDFGAAVGVAVGSLVKSVRGIASLASHDISKSCTKVVNKKSLFSSKGKKDPNETINLLSRSVGDIGNAFILNGEKAFLSKPQEQIVYDIISWVDNCLVHKSTNNDFSTSSESRIAKK